MPDDALVYLPQKGGLGMALPLSSGKEFDPYTGFVRLPVGAPVGAEYAPPGETQGSSFSFVMTSTGWRPAPDSSAIAARQQAITFFQESSRAQAAELESRGYVWSSELQQSVPKAEMEAAKQGESALNKYYEQQRPQRAGELAPPESDVVTPFGRMFIAEGLMQKQATGEVFKREGGVYTPYISSGQTITPSVEEQSHLVSRAPSVTGFSESFVPMPFRESSLAGYQVKFEGKQPPYYLKNYLMEQAVTRAVEQKYGLSWLSAPSQAKFEEGSVSKALFANVLFPSGEKRSVLIEEPVVSFKEIELLPRVTTNEKLVTGVVSPFQSDLTEKEFDIGSRYLTREQDISTFLKTTPLLREYEGGVAYTASLFGGIPFVREATSAASSIFLPSTYIRLGSLGLAASESVVSNPTLFVSRIGRGGGVAWNAFIEAYEPNEIGLINPRVLEKRLAIAGTVVGLYLGSKAISSTFSAAKNIGSKLVSTVETPKIILTQPATKLTRFTGEFKLGGKPIETGIVYEIPYTPKSLLSSLDFSIKAQAAAKSFKSFSSQVKSVIGHEARPLQLGDTTNIAGTSIFENPTYFEYNRFGLKGLGERVSQAFSQVQQRAQETQLSILSRFGEVPITSKNIFTGKTTFTLYPKATPGEYLIKTSGVYRAGDELYGFFNTPTKLPATFGKSVPTTRVYQAAKQVYDVDVLLRGVRETQALARKSGITTIQKSLNLGEASMPKLSPTQLADLKAFTKASKLAVKQAQGTPPEIGFSNLFKGSERPLAPLHEQVYAGEHLIKLDGGVTFDNIASGLSKSKTKIISIPPKYAEGLRGIEISSIEGKLTPLSPSRLLRIPPKYAEGLRGIEFQDIASKKPVRVFSKPLKPFKLPEPTKTQPPTSISGSQIQIQITKLATPQTKLTSNAPVPTPIKASSITVYPASSASLKVFKPTAPVFSSGQYFIPAIGLSYKRSIDLLNKSFEDQRTSKTSIEIFLSRLKPTQRPTEIDVLKEQTQLLPVTSLKAIDSVMFKERLAEQTVEKTVAPTIEKTAAIQMYRELTKQLEPIKLVTIERTITKTPPPPSTFAFKPPRTPFIPTPKYYFEPNKQRAFFKRPLVKRRGRVVPVVLAGPFSKLRVEARTKRPAFHPIQTRGLERKLYRNLSSFGAREIKAIPFRKKSKRFLV